jgi:hypothetical protein
MKRMYLGIALALLTFILGVYTTAQVNRAAHHFIPDIDNIGPPAPLSQPPKGPVPCSHFHKLKVTQGEARSANPVKKNDR